MVADENLETLHEVFRAGDEGSGKRLIQLLNLSSVVNTEIIDLAKLPKDVLGTSLIPDVDSEPDCGHRIALQAEGSGKSLSLAVSF